MAASDLLDLWNDAVLNIGSKTSIASLTEQSTEAAVCAMRYPALVRRILREFDWNCVRRRFCLQEAPAGTIWPASWSYMFLYPTDCLYVRGFDIGIPAKRLPPWTMLDYEIANDSTAGNVILMNDRCEMMIYTSYEVDLANGTYEAKFDASLREALGWALAAVIAAPLTGSQANAQAVKVEALRILDEAKAANAMEGGPTFMSQDCDSLSVRGYGDWSATPSWWAPR